MTMDSSSYSLFSTIITLYLLILLYFPNLNLLLSPLLIPTFILLLSLLRLASSQQTTNRAESRPSNEPGPLPEPKAKEEEEEPCHHIVGPQHHHSGEPEPEHKPNGEEEEEPRQRNNGAHYEDSLRAIGRESFVESWDVGAPLEVIYEAYEGEEEGEGDQNDAFKDECMDRRIERYPSLSRYYPESESESDSDSSWTFEEDGFEWNEEERNEEEEEREGLIEIKLDDYYGSDYNKGMKMMIKKQIIEEVVHQIDEEDNLIEIDISLPKTDCGFSW